MLTTLEVPGANFPASWVNKCNQDCLILSIHSYDCPFETSVEKHQPLKAYFLYRITEPSVLMSSL